MRVLPPALDDGGLSCYHEGIVLAGGGMCRCTFLTAVLFVGMWAVRHAADGWCSMQLDGSSQLWIVCGLFVGSSR